ncbi:MAG: lysylphosphatidylglycerol synthase transmembrane domain-containing protein [Candidatus Aureabacteria bacterium]|nr:lysylphosphatidylglycerol synthase transmembrane domain-containing protein [Candidatus Auribacterota bacterium]
MIKEPHHRRGGFIRLITGIVLMAFVIWWVGLEKVGAAFSRIRLAWVIPILVTAYLGIALSCLRWKALLAARGINVSVHPLTFYYTIGYFFSSFLPSMFGGDLVRSYIFGKKIKSQLESFASVFMERLTGLAGLVGVAFVASVINYATLAEAGLALFMSAVFAGFIIFLILLFNKPLVDYLGGRVKWKRLAKWRERFAAFHDAIYSFRSRKKTVVIALAYSVLFQLLTSVNTYIVCLALGLQVRLLDIMIVVPLILLICTLPLTPNSMGVWEASFAFFFSRLGVPEAGALSIGLVLRAKNILVALLGGVFYTISGKELKAREAIDEG